MVPQATDVIECVVVVGGVSAGVLLACGVVGLARLLTIARCRWCRSRIKPALATFNGVQWRRCPACGRVW
jgi:hypothetical protein